MKGRKGLSGLRIAILGAGRAGRALAIEYGASGADVRVWSRRAARARSFIREFSGPRYGLQFAATPLDAAKDSDVVLLCVADQAIEEIASGLARQWRTSELSSRPVAFHISGYHTERLLAPLRRLGWPVGTLHPVGPLPETRSTSQVRWYAVQGDRSVVAMARRIAKGVGKDVLLLRGGFRERRAYHLACTLLSNGTVALFAAAQTLAAAHGRRASKALGGLLEATTEQLVQGHARLPVTGAISRGDVEVVIGHLEELRRRGDRDLERLYKLLGRRLLALAKDRLSAVEGRKLERLLSGGFPKR